MAEKPEEVFRFVNLRPVQRIAVEREQRQFARYGAGQSPLHAEIAALKGDQLREKASALARQRLSEPDEELEDLDRVQQAVRTAARESNAAAARLVVRRVLDLDPSEFLASTKGRKLHDAVWDRLYAHSIVPEMNPEGREAILAAARDLHFLTILIGQKDSDPPIRLEELNGIRLLLPKMVVPAVERREREHVRHYREMAEKGLEEVHAKLQQMNTAIDDLRHNDRRVSSRDQRTLVRFPVTTGDKIMTAARADLGGPSAVGSEHSQTGSRAVPPVAAKTAKSSRSDADAKRTGAPVLQQQVNIVPRMQPWIFTEQGRKNLSLSTLELLDNDKRGFEELEAADVIATLERQKFELLSRYLKGLSPTLLPFVKQEARYQAILDNVALPWYEFVPLPPLPLFPPKGVGSPAATPSARGIQPLGIGDLLVVRQELLRYAAGEVAHIENVMQSEFHTRSHLRARETEEIVLTETEQLEESEKDLQTTERFELQKESEKTIQEQMSLQAGLAVTASYGPVSVTAHADFALGNSTTEASRTASTYAKEVTEKSVSKIMQRAREVRTRRTLERFEEKNEHGFDNKTGTRHIIGIYRWVDKYYKARLINYGRRLMLEFIVPEPAAFMRFVETNKPLDGITIKKPIEPTVSGRRLRPDDLTKWNFNDFIARYGVEGVEPYPADTTRVSAAFAEAAPEAKNVDYAKTSEKLVIPKGYKCYDVYGEFGYQGYGGYFCEVYIGGQSWGSITARDVEGIVPISIKGYLSAFHVNVVAQCVLTDEARQAWRQKTYDAIMQAYEKALADYNEQVSAAQIQAGVRIEGRNPDLNRKLEKDELKKGVLRLLTDNFAQTRVNGTWRLDEAFDATSDFGEYGYPEFNNQEALVEGKIIQFFEQAFEWMNMTYRFYPYIWGRKENWRSVFPINDPDPQFTDFLRAGAARVVVPAHPAYAETLLHYMATSEIWNGGNPPTLNDPLYVSIVDELKADAGGDIDGTLAACSANEGYPCLAGEWEVKLPTTLVYLQPDDELPDYTT